MTKLPHESWNVTAIHDGPKYKPEAHCANPFCAAFAAHGHHIWRRSFVAGDVRWVSLDFMEPPVKVQNLCGLCVACHDDVTLGRVEILWVDGRFVWQAASWAAAPLSPQPLTLTEFNARLGAAGDSLASDPHEEHGSAEVCPTCHRSKRKRPQLEPGEKRRRGSWTVKVPDDQENGAEVLDALVDEIAERWGMDEFTSALRRYHVLVPALYAVITNHITIEEG